MGWQGKHTVRFEVLFPEGICFFPFRQSAIAVIAQVTSFRLKISQTSTKKLYMLCFNFLYVNYGGFYSRNCSVL